MALKFLVIDAGGVHTDTARTLGQEGHKVYYYTPYVCSDPEFKAFAPGVGIPEIQKVYDWGKYVDEVDCIVFPYVGMGDTADYLRHKGYNVFGAGKGEELEQNRPLSCEIMEKVGIKYPKTYVVTGIDQAMSKLQELLGQKQETNQNATGKYFVKFNVFRGSIDSFPAASLDEAKFMFDSVKAAFGPYENQVPITIQETVEGVETGADLFFNGEKFLLPGMWGFESGGNYIGYLTQDLKLFNNDLDRISKYLRSVNYRGAFSFECITNGKDNYWIDHTCRFPMPLGLMYPTFIPEWGKFILDVATGQADRMPIPAGTYLACMEIKSEDAKDRFLPIKGGKQTKFMRYMMNDGKMYSVPGSTLLGVSSIATESYTEIQKLISDEADELNIFFGVFNKKFSEDIQNKYIKPLKELGVGFGKGDALNQIESLPVPRPKRKLSENKELSDLLDRWGVPKL